MSDANGWEVSAPPSLKWSVGGSPFVGGDGEVAFDAVVDFRAAFTVVNGSAPIVTVGDFNLERYLEGSGWQDLGLQREIDPTYAWEFAVHPGDNAEWSQPIVGILDYPLRFRAKLTWVDGTYFSTTIILSVSGREYGVPHTALLPSVNSDAPRGALAVRQRHAILSARRPFVAAREEVPTYRARVPTKGEVYVGRASR